MLGRLYFERQAAFLLRFARSTSNPDLAAVLVQKAADLKAQTESPKPPCDDKSPRAADVIEWPDTNTNASPLELTLPHPRGNKSP